MKKTVLFILLLSTAYIYGASTEIIFKSGWTTMGKLVSTTDSTITLNNDVTHKDKCYSASDIVRVIFPDGVNWLTTSSNKFIDEKIVIAKQDSLKKVAELAELKRMGDPNYAVGKAMKTAGSICMGLGVPCLVTGTILCIYGNNKIPKNSSTIAGAIEVSKKYARINSSGAILAGAGCALTVAGIPLYVHGKKIMDVNLQMSDNGAGVAVKF